MYFTVAMLKSLSLNSPVFWHFLTGFCSIFVLFIFRAKINHSNLSFFDFPDIIQKEPDDHQYHRCDPIHF